jgi:hypothetical protein
VSIATVRKWHSYIGLFVAPSVLFFALTGATQLFNLHEAHGSYVPPAIVEKLSSVHKDQVFAFGDHHAPPPDAGKPGGAPGPGPGPQDDDDKTELATLLLKWFFLLVSVCLVFSTSFGIWMGLTQIRRKQTGWLLLIAGALIPLGLLLF